MEVDTFFVLAGIVLLMLIVGIASGRRNARRLATHMCRACGATHPPFAQYCRRCGQRL